MRELSGSLEGYHNVAQRKYGMTDWRAHWAKLGGDGEITWGPDPKLTPLGEEQVRGVHRAFENEREKGVEGVLPESLYCSPMSRAATTLEITWEGILLPRLTPVFKEGLRETLGRHTCDERTTKSDLAKRYPSFLFEAGFTELDVLWSPTYRETFAEQVVRTWETLDEIFATDSSAVVGITAHHGTIMALLEVVGNGPVVLPEAGVVPILVRAER